MSFNKTSVKTPKYCVHKGSGQGYVYLAGRRVYLGKHDQPETMQKYHQLVAEWIASGGQLAVDSDEITVKELVARFWVHVERYYVHTDGRPTSSRENFRQALIPLKELHGDTRVADFGPRALIAIRQKMIERGWCRTHINRSIVLVRTMFRWGVEQELVAGSLHHALQAVAGLRKGRCGARESDPVKPVPIEHVNAIKPFVSRQVWAIIRLQLLSGARAGELVGLRPCSINTTGHIWTVTPEDHKTAHHGHQRTIYFGPRAQAVLESFLTRQLDTPMFSPNEAEQERRKKMHAARTTPMSYGNRACLNKVIAPQRSAGDVYNVASYRRAIARACDQAFQPPEPIAQHDGETKKAWIARLTADQRERLAKWQAGHRWHPHQLRHNAATELRKEFGIEVARIILGHRSAAITEVYAELDQAKAVEAMMRVG